MYGDQSGEFVFGYWGLRGYKCGHKPVLVEGEDQACTKASHRTNCRRVVKNKLGCSKFSTETKALV